MESDLCYRIGDHYACNGRLCTCPCHPRGRRADRLNGLEPQATGGAATWHPGDDELWA